MANIGEILTEDTDLPELEDYSENHISPEHPFDPTKINISIRPLVIDNLIKRLKSKPSRIDMDTDFQRLGNLWDDTKQSRLIESLLLRIPLPVFFFDGTNDNCWKIVDGLQRLWVFKNFIVDKTLKLQNLEYLVNLNGYSYDSLPEYLKSRIEETGITAHVINPGTPQNVKYNVFKRINTGGLTLNQQEIRHCLNSGKPANFLKELSDMDSFQRIISNTNIDPKRMQDRELVLRFICFYRMKENYPGDMNNTLDQAMIDIEKLSEEEMQKIKNDFIKATNFIYAHYTVPWIFTSNYNGNSHYTRKTHKKIGISKNLFSIWMVVHAKYSDIKISDSFLKDAILLVDDIKNGRKSYREEYYYIIDFIQKIGTMKYDY